MPADALYVQLEPTQTSIKAHAASVNQARIRLAMFPAAFNVSKVLGVPPTPVFAVSVHLECILV